jgi:hypothetical protein
MGLRDEPAASCPAALQPEELTNALEISNIVFTSLFALEMLLKLLVYGPFGYIKNPYNIFDGVIVVIRYDGLPLPLAVRMPAGVVWGEGPCSPAHSSGVEMSGVMPQLIPRLCHCLPGEGLSVVPVLGSILSLDPTLLL